MEKCKKPFPTFELWNYVHFRGVHRQLSLNKIKMLQSVHGYSEMCFGTYLARSPRSTFAHCKYEIEREKRKAGKGKRGGEGRDKERKSRSINLFAFTVGNSVVHTVGRAVLYIYLNRKLINLPPFSASWNVELLLFAPRDI